MDIFEWLRAGSTDWWSLLWPALTIAALRVTDVTVSVFKTTCVVKGRRGGAAAFAGLEAGLWLAAAGIVFSDLTLARGVGFAVGVAGGTWLGMKIVDEAKLGLVTVRVFVAAHQGRELAGHVIAERIRRTGFGATLFPGWGREGEVHMLLSVVRRRDAERVMEVVRDTDPDAFVSVDNHPAPTSWAGVPGRARV